jgi:hypothetical protein
MQPGCSPSPMVIRRDDHQPCGGVKQAGLRPLPRPQLQGCSSSGLRRKARRVGSCLPCGPVARFFLQHSREKGILQPYGGDILQLCGGRRTAAAWTGCSCPSSTRATIVPCAGGCCCAVLKWWPPLVRLPTAAVASVDETVSATCASDLQLFGFNG